MAMKLKVIAGAGALLWMSAVSPVLAADIRAAPIVKAPIIVEPVQNWYGFYIGVNGGYAWGRGGIELLPDAFFLPAFTLGAIPTTLAANPRGGVFGITYGSNYQFGQVVLGIDSDFDWSGIKSSQTFNGVFPSFLGPIPFTATASQSLKWFSTTRVRGGIEYANGPWQFRTEYLHYDLGTLSYFLRDPIFPGPSIIASTRFSGDMIRGAITYRFNWTLLGLITGSDRL